MAVLDADLQENIEAYLLGRLSEEEQPRIEALLFEDDTVFEAIRDAEDDLIDRYLAGELVQADRDAFENVFATTTTRQERIALARALLRGAESSAPAENAAAPGTAENAAAVQPAAAEPAPVQPAAAEPVPVRRARSTAFRRVVVPTGAGLAAAVVIAVAWRFLPSNRVVSPPALDATTQQPLEAPAVATLSLSRMDLRRGAGNLPRLVLRKATTAVRLEPELEAPIPAAGTAVTLRRVEGPVAWHGTLNVEGGRPSLTVPVQSMGPGDYVLSVAVPGAPPEDRAEYPFRVIARD